jgi:outer membrane protein OmpA-like peptidoglycan-associated protein
MNHQAANRMIRRIIEDEEQPAKVPGWTFTYIDLLWLLLLFFILRGAIGVVGDNRHYREITAALKKRFGAEAAATPGDDANKAATETFAADRTQYSEALREGFDDTAAARQRSLALQGTLRFADGEKMIANEHKQILQAVAEQIGPTKETIEIRGEAAARPRTGDAADPAYTRCVSARDQLVKLGIAPDRLRIAVVAQRRPAGERPRVQLYAVVETVAETPKKPLTKR